MSNLGLLANTRTRSKNDDGFDDPQQNEAAERRRRNRVSRFGWWCERNREREGEKRGAAASRLGLERRGNGAQRRGNGGVMVFGNF